MRRCSILRLCVFSRVFASGPGGPLPFTRAPLDRRRIHAFLKQCFSRLETAAAGKGSARFLEQHAQAFDMADAQVAAFAPQQAQAH